MDLFMHMCVCVYIHIVALSDDHFILLSSSTEDLDRLPQHDLDYLLQLLDKRVENVLKLSHPPLHPSLFMEPARSEIPADMFCRGEWGDMMTLAW